MVLGSNNNNFVKPAANQPVLISLAVARLITPMMAAYLLKPHGQQSHGEGWLMDRYMSILHWSMDSTKAKEIKGRLPRVPKRAVYLLFALALGLVAAGIAIFAPQPGDFAGFGSAVMSSSGTWKSRGSRCLNPST